MKSKVFMVALMIALLGLTACGNTFQGMGQDIEKMGEKIQNY